jgi:hypothetical protein
MTARRTYILLFLLIGSVLCRSQAGSSGTISSSEYRAELDRLSSATVGLDSSDHPTPQAFHELPGSWHVHTGHGDFEISSEGLQGDVRRYDADKNATTAMAIGARVASLRSALDGYENPAQDISTQRADLNSILARPEFRDVHGPSRLDRWTDRLKVWLQEILLRMLRGLFHTAAIPNVGRFFIYGLVGTAALLLGYLVYRNFVWGANFEGVTPKELPVSAKEWAVWLGEARAQAAQANWREAIHLAYWAGISFLERQGTWKPDRARTPREYLRLLSNASEHRETLITLTRIFEVAWYAKRNANESAFSQTLEQLEKLGCR